MNDRETALEIIRIIAAKEGMTAEEAEAVRAELGLEPCTLCGACCRKVPCCLCLIIFGDIPSCPMLVDNQCEFVKNSRGVFHEDTVRLILSLGVGCTNPHKD